MTSILRAKSGDRDGAEADEDRHDDQKGGEAGGQRVKNAHIISEFIDVGVAASAAYDQWTQYDKWAEMFKKESARTGRGAGRRGQSGDSRGRQVTVTAKIAVSKRQWKAEILERTPGSRITWRATDGIQAKGVTTFHSLDDRLTRLMVEIEYHPSGFFETVGNFFRMPRRRVRKDLKLFKSYIELKGQPTGRGPGPLNGEGLRTEVDRQTGHEQQEG
jgi:hypothetical protein